MQGQRKTEFLRVKCFSSGFEQIQRPDEGDESIALCFLGKVVVLSRGKSCLNTHPHLGETHHEVAVGANT